MKGQSFKEILKGNLIVASGLQGDGSTVCPNSKTFPLLVEIYRS